MAPVRRGETKDFALLWSTMVEELKTEKARVGRSPTMAPSPWGEVLLEDERKDLIAPGKTKMMGLYQLVTKY